jgi:cysteine desulfurase
MDICLYYREEFMIYLDNSATTPIHPEVLKAMMPYLKGGYGNAGAVYRIGRESAKAIQKAREQVAQLFNASADQIVFTSGGSEGNNMVFSYGMRCMLEERGKKHVVISQIEHDSVYEAATHMFKPSGKVNIKDDFYTQFIHTKSDGTVDVKHLEALLDEDESIGLVSVMYVNNETGAVNPINHIGEICRDRGILFHTDCVQAAGCHPIDANIIGCDFATISGHKIYAPKGIGAIYIKDKTLARSLIYGGTNQEFGLRGGTENVASIVGLGKACDLICSDFGTQRVTVSLLKRLFYENMTSYLKELNLEDRIHVNGASVGDVGKTLNLRVEDIDSETLLLMLDAKGVCISAGSACHSHRSEPSRVLTAMGLSDDEARDSVRISFSSTNTPAEIEEAAAIFSSCIKTLAGLQR